MPLLTLSLCDHMKTLWHSVSRWAQYFRWVFLKGNNTTGAARHISNVCPQMWKELTSWNPLSGFTASSFLAELLTGEVGYSAFLLLFGSPLNDKVEHPHMEHVACFPYLSDHRQNLLSNSCLQKSRADLLRNHVINFSLNQNGLHCHCFTLPIGGTVGNDTEWKRRYINLKKKIEKAFMESEVGRGAGKTVHTIYKYLALINIFIVL